MKKKKNNETKMLMYYDKMTMEKHKHDAPGKQWRKTTQKKTNEPTK